MQLLPPLDPNFEMFGIVLGYFFDLELYTHSLLLGPFCRRFVVDFLSEVGPGLGKLRVNQIPKRIPRTVKLRQTRQKQRSKQSRAHAFRKGGSSLVGFGVVLHEAKLRPKTPVCKPRTFKTKVQKCIREIRENVTQ
jgi:hypothetical protein